ncbi:hypothetical protein [Methanosarcina siciliae]|uniref:hypothetical protein n=1 Tax=Methanosarcina siciliae TaxID=38027 RepID=UPI0012E040C6|nr:hypothetical protein [Methanosarcina siciliae]
MNTACYFFRDVYRENCVYRDLKGLHHILGIGISLKPHLPTDPGGKPHNKDTYIKKNEKSKIFLAHSPTPERIEKQKASIRRPKERQNPTVKRQRPILDSTLMPAPP